MKTAAIAWRPYERSAAILLLIVVVATPFFGSKLAVYNLTITALFAIAVIGLNLLLGLAGQASFAQTSFMAIGGYGTALLTTRFGWNPWAAIGVSVGLAVVCAYVIGRPLLRLRGHYLSMATFALSLGVYYFVTAADWLTNGGSGIAGVPALAVFDVSLASPKAFYILAWSVCLLWIVGFVLLSRSHVGRAWRAIATGQDIAMALGIDVVRYKVLAFMIAAAAAGVSGALYVEYTSFVGPDLYDINIILNLFFMLFVGGRGSTIGAVAGSAILVLVPQLLSGLEQYQNLLFFLGLMVVLRVRPHGLFGGLPLAMPAAVADVPAPVARKVEV
jgi:branched-chain amino acid transport system permease protein